MRDDLCTDERDDGMITGEASVVGPPPELRPRDRIVQVTLQKPGWGSLRPVPPPLAALCGRTGVDLQLEGRG